MKAFVLAKPAGAEGAELRDIPAPGPIGPGQVRIAVRAVSLNYRDLLAMAGALGFPPEGLIPCSDCAGEVVETGENVWRVRPGDRVALTFNPDWIGGAWAPSPGAAGRGGAIPGVLREEVVVDQDETVMLPDGLSFEEGSTLPCAGVTAWRALCGGSPLLPGMTVLVQGGGGVSVFALQFAKLFGARAIAISSSSERCARLRELGADETINYRERDDWDAVVRQLTAGRGVDLAVDVGGAATIGRSLAATAAGGRLAVVGLLGGPPTLSAALMSSGVTIAPSMAGSREDFEAMNRAIAYHGLRPAIDDVLPFEHFVEAVRRLQSGQQFGKIVVRLP